MKLPKVMQLVMDRAEAQICIYFKSDALSFTCNIPRSLKTPAPTSKQKGGREGITKSTVVSFHTRHLTSSLVHPQRSALSPTPISLPGSNPPHLLCLEEHCMSPYNLATQKTRPLSTALISSLFTSLYRSPYPLQLTLSDSTKKTFSLPSRWRIVLLPSTF